MNEKETIREIHQWHQEDVHNDHVAAQLTRATVALHDIHMRGVLLANGYDKNSNSDSELSENQDYEFYIVNCSDKPCEENVAQKINERECVYLHKNLEHHCKRKLHESATSLKEFGFKYEIKDGWVNFSQVNNCYAKYPDGQSRFWQGKQEFGLRLWGITDE